jgi:hypothetical protein
VGAHGTGGGVQSDVFVVDDDHDCLGEPVDCPEISGTPPPPGGGDSQVVYLQLVARNYFR